MKIYNFILSRLGIGFLSFLLCSAVANAAIPVIDSPSTASATVGESFTYDIETVADDAFLYGTSSNLPDGIIRSGATLAGVPTVPGRYVIRLDAINAEGTGNATLVLTVYNPVPVITSGTTVVGRVGQNFSYSITATNTPDSYSEIGLSAFPGLSLDPVSGIISGIPTLDSSTDILVSATNPAGTASQLVLLVINPAQTAPSTPTVLITSPSSGITFDGALQQIDVSAEVTPIVGETLDVVYVRWNNPTDPSLVGIVLTEMTEGATDGTTGAVTYTATVDVGFNQNDRQIGGGFIDIDVVAFQANAATDADAGTDQVTFTIKPIVEFLFPDEEFAMDSIAFFDIFASARLSTNDFVSITARIAGSSIVDTVVDLDESNNPNGVFNFLATKKIDFPGFYEIRITAEDGSGNLTILERRILISDTLAQPVATLTAPTPGFTNEVFSAAVFSFAETRRELVTVNEVGVVGVNVTYALGLISGGQGYYPRNASDVTVPATAVTTSSSISPSLTIGVGGITVANGRVTELPDSFTVFYDNGVSGGGTRDDEWQAPGNAILDDLRNPGLNGWISMAGQFFKANAELSSYKLFVNGEDVTPGAGNLDPFNGVIDIPVTLYPGAGRGSPAPGDYIAYAQVTDQQGEVGTSEPLAFTIVAYEPLEISLTRPSTGDVAQGTAVEFLVEVTPNSSIETVEFFDSDSGDSLGFAGGVKIDGQDRYRFTQNFNEQGSFGVYTSATAFNGQSVDSDPIRISVTPVDDLEVYLISPDSDQTVIIGQSLSFEAEASSSAGVTSITLIVDNVEVETVTTAPYQFSYLFDQINALPYNVRVSAIDNFGYSAGSIEEVNVTVTASDVDVTITSTLVDNSVVIGAAQTFSTTTVASVGVASVEWYVNDDLAMTSTTAPFSFDYTFSSSGPTNLRAVAFDTLGNSASDSKAITVNLANPLLRDGDFVSYAYLQLTGSSPTARQLADALVLLDGSPEARIAYLETLFASDGMAETLEVMMVYRTMTGEWPDATELIAARAGLLGGTSSAGSQTGNIDTGGTQTFDFTYTAGDSVTVRVAADASNGDPLTDATLRIVNPSGAIVAYSDDSFFSLDPLVNFTATAAGTYTATVGGYLLQSGDFTITSTSSSSGSTSSASVQALVQSLIPEFEARFDMTFPTSSLASGTQATNLVNQLFKNKHGVNPSPQATVRLKASLTGSDSESLPGYSGDLTVFTSAFALDNSRSSFNQAYSSVHYYEIPNQPISDVPLALMIAMFLGEDPSDQALAGYGGMTQAQAFEDFLTDPRYYEQFPPTSVESFVNLALAALGIFDQSLNGPADDADSDGVSNLMEIALGSDPTDLSDSIEPMASEIDGTDFVITFIRIIASEVPGDFIISLECSEDMIVWDTAMDTGALASGGVLLQNDVPEGYERVEIRIDMTAQNCGFFRLSVNLP